MSKKLVVSRNAPCPCGSGKKYKSCCALKEDRRRHWLNSFFRWIGGAAVVFLIIYIISQISSRGTSVGYQRNLNKGSQRNSYYTDADIDDVDFSELSAEQKERVLNKANNLQCTCGCRMTLAECVAIDSTCPLRGSNIERISDLLKEESR
ncbi:MAG: SEC-C metal-binding domain-containing protein [Omnitrophica bacterium]|nr:SEC-C metal-binding domain-containing protein [Candidatus Omnitrophota bacterium]